MDQSVLHSMSYLQRQMLSCFDQLLVGPSSNLPLSPLPPVPPFHASAFSSFHLRASPSPSSSSKHPAPLLFSPRNAAEERGLSSGADMSEDEHQLTSDSAGSSPHADTTASSDSSASKVAKTFKRRLRIHKLNNRRGKRHLDPSTSTKEVRKTLSSVEDLPASADLEIPPLIIPADDQVPDEPSLAAAGYDEFTTHWYERYQRAVSSKQKEAFTVKGVCSDAFYIHLVKELLHRGHLEQCGIASTHPRMYAALKARLGRNGRHILFRAVIPEVGDDGEEVHRSVPVLYTVRPSSFSTSSPTHTECVRVVPISQLRLLLEETHTTQLHRVTAVFPHLQKLYANVTRDMCDEFNKFCNHCNAKKAHSARRHDVHPIMSRTPRERYVIDFIDMKTDPDSVEHEGTYKWILHMIDHASKYRWARACKTKHASGVQRIVKEWWCEWGRPEILHSDNGGEFTADLIADLCLEWGVQKRHGRPHRPQTQGVIERANRQLKAYLAAWRANPANSQLGWVAALPVITRAANHAHTRAIRSTPHDAFPRPESSRTVPGKGKLDLGDRQDIELEPEEPDSEADEEDTRRALLDIIGDAAGKEDIVNKIIEADRRAEPRAAAPAFRPVAAEPEVVVISAAAGVRDDHAASSSPVAAEEEGDDSASAVEPIVDGDVEIAPMAMRHSSDSKDEVEALAELGQWQQVDGADILMFSELEEKLDRDDPIHPLGSLHCIPIGEVEPLWFPQWGEVYPSLPRLVRAVGVVADGNCGPSAAYSARAQVQLQNRPATFEEYNDNRTNVLQWLLKSQHRVLYESWNKSRVCDVDILIGQCGKNKAYVFPDFFRVYAWMHKLNVFLFSVDARTVQEDRDKPESARLNSTFSCQLFNTLDDGSTTLQAAHLNTIAVHFHHCTHIRRKTDEDSFETVKNTGHFEYFIDGQNRSFWRAKDPIVTECFEVAVKQTANYRRLHHYAEQMKLQERHRDHAMRFRVGQVANLQVREGVRKAVPASQRLHKNMYVRLLDEPHPERQRRSFTALSHAGVLSECVPTQDLQECGQDVDEDLLSRVVTADDLAKRVTLLTAWKLEVHRERGRHATAATVAVAAVNNAAMLDDDSDRVGPVTRSRSATGASAARVPQGCAPSSSPSTHLCASCSRQFTLPAGKAVVRCIGRCQQSLHTLANQCSKSTHWMQMEGGRVCSNACLILFASR